MKRPLRTQQVAAVLVCAALSCTGGCHGFLNAATKGTGSFDTMHSSRTILKASGKEDAPKLPASASRLRINNVPKNSLESKSNSGTVQRTSTTRRENAGSSTLERNDEVRKTKKNGLVATLPRSSRLNTKTSTTARRKKKTLPLYYSRYSMMEHEILTAEEEQILGKRLQRSIKMKNELRLLVELRRTELDEKRAKLEDERQRQIEEDQELEGLDGLMKSLYGGSFQESYGEDDDDIEDELSGFTVELAEVKLVEYDRSRLWANAATSGLEPELENEEDGGDTAFDDRIVSDQLIQDENLLSDHDIVHTLGVTGGRKELYQILLQGALAKDKIIRSNIRLVVSIAKKWARQQPLPAGASDAFRFASIYGGSSDRPSLDEAIQEGILGLATAADKFEPERNLKFGTYATYWITSFVRKCFQTAVTGSLRIPPNYHVTKQNYKKLVKKYYETEGASPPMEVIAEELGVTPKRLMFILKTSEPLISIDAPFSRGRGPSVGGKAGGDVIDDANFILTQTLAW
jgi:DNA-directed RNA polymerase sigma subunit (sigma70/sigma32)